MRAIHNVCPDDSTKAYYTLPLTWNEIATANSNQPIFVYDPYYQAWYMVVDVVEESPISHTVTLSNNDVYTATDATDYPRLGNDCGK